MPCSSPKMYKVELKACLTIPRDDVTSYTARREQPLSERSLRG
jgi:hypothetical protein